MNTQNAASTTEQVPAKFSKLKPGDHFTYCKKKYIKLQKPSVSTQYGSCNAVGLHDGSLNLFIDKDKITIDKPELPLVPFKDIQYGDIFEHPQYLNTRYCKLPQSDQYDLPLYSFRSRAGFYNKWRDDELVRLVKKAQQ